LSLKEHKLNEKEILKILTEVAVTRSEAEIKLDEEDFGEKEKINKRKMLLIEGIDVDKLDKISKKKKKSQNGSEVLNCYLRQQNYPPWTSYFVEQKHVINDQYKLTYFINNIDNNDYLILRTGCFPLIKYHCTKLSDKDKQYLDSRFVNFQNSFFRLIKILNLGIPTLAYGIMGKCLITHSEVVKTPKGDVKIYFLIKENKKSYY
ncbi:unnamed protein product, partial [Brachionus calyciflorus]